MADRSNPLTSSDYLRHTVVMPLSEMDRSRIQNFRIDLTETDVDDWRDAVLFGTGPLGAYTPDPEAFDGLQATGVWMDEIDVALSAAVLAQTAIPVSAAPPPIAWQGRAPSRAVQAVKIGLTAVAVVFAVGVLGAWLA
ncbi:MAG: hypothetical protein KJ728_11800 [Alphaproteobacteria bacterium]|uniref:Uncharacterized protein n=1 Tax=viral metagenome TaxID=1070528 RepID=A0A6M3XBZ9_9ZZZZ|nr:hypothetical protein [Alphaproteobacteria bacterium]